MHTVFYATILETNCLTWKPIEPNLAAPPDCLGSNYHSLELYELRIHSPRVPLMLVQKN